MTAMSMAAAERERLRECVKEPVRRPGSIQSHGVLLAVGRTSWTVTQASENTEALVGLSAKGLQGEPVRDLIGEHAVARLVAVLGGVRGASNPVPVTCGGLEFDAIVHETDGVIVIELEPVLPGDEFASVPAVYAAATRVPAATTRELLWSSAAEQFQELTGFDRVMVYHFHPDGHGQVVGEECADDSMEPYIGLHYPASDIPPQARELYLTKLSRTIYSTEDDACSLVPAEGAGAERLDLSRAELRAVSLHHLQFMRNMGQASTLSFSLIAGGELIGMINCAHRTRRRLPYVLRQSLEVLATQVAAQLNAMAEIGRLTRAAELLELRKRLVAQFARRGGDLVEALLHDEVTVLDLIPADAAALHVDGSTTTLGVGRHAAGIEMVMERLRANGTVLPFASDALLAEHPALAELLPSVAGLLIAPLGDGQDYLAWLRPEITETTEWLGDQSESNRETPLSPRNSFSAWSGSVTGQAHPWEGLDKEAAALCSDLDAAVQRTNESNLAHLGLHDGLTGLPNRRLLMDRFDQAMAHRLRGDGIAVLFIDIDSFKSINDSLGHDQGDAVLIQVAERLRAGARKADTVARLGGDEFVVLCEDVDHGTAVNVAGRVLAALRAPLVVNGNPVPLSASVGVAMAVDGDTASDMIRRADAAMYRAKRGGKDRASD